MITKIALKGKIENFGRFYAAFKQIPLHCDANDLKVSLVRQFTNNRTSSLREMTPAEYRRLCICVESEIKHKVDMTNLRAERSAVLHLMQKCGIDTSDWSAVNSFCQSQKIAGKRFSQLDEEELRKLYLRLRMILRKGGLKHRKNTAKEQVIVVMPKQSHLC